MSFCRGNFGKYHLGDDVMDDLSMIAPFFLDEHRRLTAFPAKNRKKLIALCYLAQKIEPERAYTESEINDLLDSSTTFHDPAALRRELYNKHLLDRTADCKSSWKETEIPSVVDFISHSL